MSARGPFTPAEEAAIRAIVRDVLRAQGPRSTAEVQRRRRAFRKVRQAAAALLAPKVEEG